MLKARAINNELNLSLVSPSYELETIVTEWSVEPIQFGIFLTTIFDEWVRKDVGKYFVQIFDVALEIWYSGQSSFVFLKRLAGSYGN